MAAWQECRPGSFCLVCQGEAGGMSPERPLVTAVVSQQVECAFCFLGNAKNWTVFVYLFMIYFGCTGSCLLRVGILYFRWAGAICCSALTSPCGAFLLRSVGSRVHGLQWLQLAGSVVVYRVSCTAACGIFPDQRSNPCPLLWQVDS